MELRYLERLNDLKLFMQTHSDWFSKWDSIKIGFVVMRLRVLDFIGFKGGKGVVLKVVNRII